MRITRIVGVLAAAFAVALPSAASGKKVKTKSCAHKPPVVVFQAHGVSCSKAEAAYAANNAGFHCVGHPTASVICRVPGHPKRYYRYTAG